MSDVAHTQLVEARDRAKRGVFEAEESQRYCKAEYNVYAAKLESLKQMYEGRKAEIERDQATWLDRVKRSEGVVQKAKDALDAAQKRLDAAKPKRVSEDPKVVKARKAKLDAEEAEKIKAAKAAKSAKKEEKPAPTPTAPEKPLPEKPGV